MIKTIKLFNIFASRKNEGNNKVVGLGISGNDKKPANKLRKLLKLRKTFKSKKLSKNGKLIRFDFKKAGLNFLTFDMTRIFNRLWLVFIKALIF